MNGEKDMCAVCEEVRAAPTRGKRCQSCFQNWANSQRRHDKLARYQAHCNSARSKTRDPLPYDAWVLFWQMPCEWCKSPLKTIGIDRIDNDGLYTLENCQSLCQVCNGMKGAQENDRALAHIRKIAEANTHIEPRTLSRFFYRHAGENKADRRLLIDKDDPRFQAPRKFKPGSSRPHLTALNEAAKKDRHESAN